MKNILLIGLGAIGSLVASKFSDKNVELDILLDTKRYSKYKDTPIYVNGKQYQFNYVENKTCTKLYDFVIIAVKYHHLPSVLDELEGLLSNDCTIMSLLNGIDSEEIIGGRFGIDKCVYAFITNTDATRVDRTVSFKADGKIFYGERDGTISDRIKLIAAVFDKIGMNYRPVQDIITKQWKKFMINIGLNQVSAVLKAPYGYFLKSEDIMSLTKAAMEEVVNVANAVKIKLRPSDIERSLAYLSALAPEGKTSMLQDVEAQRKTEVEMLSMKLIELGEEHNISTPINKVLFLQIKALESLYEQ